MFQERKRYPAISEDECLAEWYEKQIEEATSQYLWQVGDKKLALRILATMARRIRKQGH